MTKIVEGKRPPAEWWESLKFEDAVPLPAPRIDLAEAVKDMKVGQSFVIPYTRHPRTANLARATGWKFTQAREGDNLRIWRTE